jgi:hypothetical protein
VSDPHAANVPRIGIDLPSAPRFGRKPVQSHGGNHGENSD